jgi:hypothetical protein
MMTEGLRAGAIQAVAEVLWMMDKPWDYQHRTPWAVESKGRVDVYMAKAAAALDALLDFLGEHTEEWERVFTFENGNEVSIGKGTPKTSTSLLLAALRSGVEET